MKATTTATIPKNLQCDTDSAIKCGGVVWTSCCLYDLTGCQGWRNYSKESGKRSARILGGRGPGSVPQMYRTVKPKPSSLDATLPH